MQGFSQKSATNFTGNGDGYSLLDLPTNNSNSLQTPAKFFTRSTESDDVRYSAAAVARSRFARLKFAAQCRADGLHKTARWDGGQRVFSPPGGADDLNRLLCSSALDDFGSALSLASRRRMALKTDDGSLRIIGMRYRFGRSYGGVVADRIGSLIDGQRGRPAQMLTLTFDPKRYDNDLAACWGDAKRQLNRFMTRLRRRVPGLEYLAALEAHKSGWPHYHIAFPSRSRLLDFRELREMWGCGFLWIGGHNKTTVRNPIHYVCKYVLKVFGSADADGLRYSRALCWFFSVRSYSSSRGLLAPLNSPAGSAVFIGFVVVAYADRWSYSADFLAVVGAYGCCKGDVPPPLDTVK